MTKILAKKAEKIAVNIGLKNGHKKCSEKITMRASQRRAGEKYIYYINILKSDTENPYPQFPCISSTTLLLV